MKPRGGWRRPDDELCSDARALIAALDAGATTTREIAAATGIPSGYVSPYLNWLVGRGTVERTDEKRGRGFKASYRLKKARRNGKPAGN